MTESQTILNATPAEATPAPSPNPIPSPSRRFRLSFTSPIVYLLLVTYLLIVVYPIFWLFYSSLKTDQQIFLHPFDLPSIHDLHPENFSAAWTKARFQSYFVNSVVLTLSTVIVTTFLASMTAYALARFQFRGSKPILYFFLAGLMIPLQLAIVPLFFELKTFNLLDSRTGLFLVYLAFGFPFAVFVLTGFFKSLPASLHESALLDGATEYGAFWHIMLPLARPGLITVAIFLFLGNWNEFFVAFICLSGKPADALPFASHLPTFALHHLDFLRDPQTLPLGIAKVTIVANYRSDWGMAFAGLVLMMLPTLIAYIFLQKHLTKGITAGAVKG